MQAVTSSDQVKDVLSGIRNKGRDPYNFYCALLHTRQPGLDRELREHIREHYQTLDDLTGTQTLVFAFSEFDPEPDIGALASGFDVPVDTLPCAVLFCDPLITDRRIVFPFADVLPPHEQRRDGHITDAFKLMIASLDAAGGGPGRLERLSTELNQRLDPFVAANRPQAPKPPGKGLAWIREGSSIAAVLVAIGAWQSPNAPPPAPTPTPTVQVAPAAQPANAKGDTTAPGDPFAPAGDPLRGVAHEQTRRRPPRRR